MELLKRNKGKLIASSIVILLPMLLGLLAKKLLPEEVAIHWNAHGVADGWGNPALVFLILPPILLLFHW